MSGPASAFFHDIADVASGTYKCYLNGAWRLTASGATLSVKNPATRQAEYQVGACTRDEVDECFEGARKAQEVWRTTPLWKRAEALKAAARLLRENKSQVASVLVKEVAKARKDAESECVRSADLMDYCAEEGIRLLCKGDLITSDPFPGADRNKLCLASRVPLGTVLCIPPFNYPVNLCVSKLAPALIAGNAVVVKPPTQGAVSGLHLAQCFHKTGLFPPGLLNFATINSRQDGDHMVAHKGVDCVSFTGGDTGLRIAEKVGMVPLQMELGGKDACLVCEDADLDLAAKHIVKGGFSYSGQRCTAVKVVLVHEKVADDLVAKVCQGASALTVGMPEDNCAITPVISESSAEFITSLVEDAKQKGAKLCGEWRREDNLIWPLVVDHVRADMRLAWEEPFGPVVPFMRVASMEDAVTHANANRYALQSCVFTRDIDAAVKLSDAIKAGTVQVNGAPARGPDHFPFQGFRDSGIGSQGITNSVLTMTKAKTTVINLSSPSYTVG